MGDSHWVMPRDKCTADYQKNILGEKISNKEMEKNKIENSSRTDIKGNDKIEEIIIVWGCL